MNSDLQNKQFVALELTKILFNDKVKYQKEAVYSAYQYFLLNATNLYEVIDTFELLKSENDKLQKEINDLKANNQDILTPFKTQIIKLVNDSRGDMEPYVYTTLVNTLEKDI